MTLRQTATRLGAGATAAIVVLAGLTLWLVLSDPVTVAGAIGDRDVPAVAWALAKMLGRELVRLVFGR